MVAELSQLRQTCTVVEFQAHFEQLKSRVLERWPDLHEGLITDWFMGGLKKGIRDSLQMQFPHSLNKANTLTRLQEFMFDQVLPQSKPTYKPFTYIDHSTLINPKVTPYQTHTYLLYNTINHLPKLLLTLPIS